MFHLMHLLLPEAFVPIVVLTALGEPEVLKDCLEAGAGDSADRFHGRGILLLKTLARDPAFNEAGDRVSFSLYAAVGGSTGK
jgi:CheY-like chemotaxis protein